MGATPLSNGRPRPASRKRGRARGGAAGAPFDFALVDGLHIRSQVRRDIDGLTPHLADEAYVLFHDACHYGVADAIAERVRGDDRWHDCGYLCRGAQVGFDPVTPYNGFRLLRWSRARVTDVGAVVAPAYARLGRAAPPADESAMDHDGWYCRNVSPCPRCRAARDGSARDPVAIVA